MFIQTELTPNPQTLKFLPGRVVMDKGTAFFQNKSECSESPLAEKLFSIEGVEGVFFGSDFLSITKQDIQDWQVLKPIVLGAIVEHFNSGEAILIKSKVKNPQTKNSSTSSEEKIDNDIEKQIKELLDTRVRPAVAMDGGDIIFDKFKQGIVYLHMQGACSGCPSSTATLRTGIENMLKHYMPEIKEVRASNENE